MNENENNNPLFENDGEEAVSPTELSAEKEAAPTPAEDEAFAQSENFVPVKEVYNEASENESDASSESEEPVEASFSDEEQLASPDFEEAGEPEYTSSEEEVAEAAEKPNEAEAGSADTGAFNPYAPRNSYENTWKPNQNSGVNPGYTQPFNAQRPNGNGGYPTNYGYNNSYNQGYGAPEKNNGGKKAVSALVILCLAVAVIALVSSFFGGKEKPQTSTSTAPHSAIPTETTAATTIPAIESTNSQAVNSTTALQTTQQTTAQPTTQVVNSIWVAEKVRPSVVGVLAYQQGELAGEGSGVLMSESEDKTCTYVVTCAHVIDEPGCEFAILLLDGSSYEAEVVALDERTDIGVLKVQATGLPLAEFGDSASLKVGEPIYAIGNPGGSEYFGSITNGIVAAIDRSISATYTMTCIQHNAAINPGNSGGALVNTAGQVIGINSSKIAKTDYEGMGFAVPSSIFASVVDSLIRYGYVPNRPELGIKYAAVSDYQLYSIIVSIKGLPKGSIVIADIPQGSALEGSGAQVGDLIIAVNGKKMDSSDVLLDLIDTGAVGDTLTLTLCRINDRSYETSTFDVTVTLVENKGSITTTTQAQTLPQQDNYGDFEDFFGGFFGW